MYRVCDPQNAKRINAYRIQLELWTGDNFTPIVGYDSAHGGPHRDEYRNGSTKVKKVRLSEYRWTYGTCFGEALNYSEYELTRNFQRYVRNYEKGEYASGGHEPNEQIL